MTSSKVAIMQRGKFVDFGPPDKVITEQSMEEIYGIKVKVTAVDSSVGYKVCLPLKNDYTNIKNKKPALEGFYAKRT
jgi:iron complex transport system ATP-binding protein